jgi:hypothetical protein
MSYAIDKQGTLDLVGGSAQYEFDVGAHAASSTVHVARAVGGTVKLGTWGLASDGTFTGGGADVVVGHGSRTRIVVFDNHCIVVLWIDGSSKLRARGYSGGGQIAGAAITVTGTVADFDVVSIGVTTGVEHAPPNTNVYYNYRQFAITTLSTNGSWSLWLGTVTDSAEVTADPSTSGGSGDKVVLSCASVNEVVNGRYPRRALTLWRDATEIKTQSWRVAAAGVTSLASAVETKPLGVGIVHGMSVAQGNDVFATVVWPGASNATSRLQLVSLAAHGAMSTYASAEIAESPQTFARLQTYGSDVAVAYATPIGQLAVAAWRFAAPGTASAPRTVLAAKTSGEQPTQVRLASLMPASDSDDDPVSLVTLSHAAGGALRLVSWRLHRTLVYSPVGPPAGIVTKP